MTLLVDLLSTVFDRRAAPIAMQIYNGWPLDEMADALVVVGRETQALGFVRAILARFAGRPFAIGVG